jgi:ribose transport system substrate-binding protein
MTTIGKRILMLAAVAIALQSVATAAGGPDDPGRVAYRVALAGKRVVLVPIAMGFDLAQGWAYWIGQDVRANGGKFEIRDPNWSSQAGAQAITEEISARPDVLILHNPDLQSYARLVQRAQAAGIYVVQIEEIGAARADAYVGSDWVNLGQLEGEAVARSCGVGTSGKLGLVQGDEVSSGSLDQLAGIRMALQKYPKMSIVAQPTSHWDASKARTVATTMLQQHPDLCGVIDFWDGSAQGTAAAIRDAHLVGKVALVTNGGGEQVDCDALQKGDFTALINTDVRRETRDINNVIKILLQSNVKPGTLKVSLFTPEVITTKADLTPDTCWRLKDLRPGATK